MGLFSFGNKNKQETVRDSGHFVKDDDAAYTERARSKRASSAGEAGRRTSRGDPILPEKKRARRRLVGAIALVLAAVVALPMLLDSEPKPLATDIAIHIPDKDKAAPLPVPSEQVAPMASVDSDEEIIEPAPAVTGPAATGTAAGVAAAEARVTAPAANDPPPMRMLEQAEPPKPEPKPAPKPEPVKPKAEPKPEPVKPEPKPEPKPEKKPEPAKKPAETHPKAEQVAKPAPKDDAARAMAILEGKPAEPQKAQGPAPRFVVQVAALASQEKVTELQERLRGAGIASFTQKSGELIRVRIGPFSKEEAEKVRAKLGGIGLSGTMVPL
ncbi:SPOR domain-containing protein [Massilia timonae]|uniref:SPOR domain-containing protein n=1 Tax=Massilia timonae TaxID=47229 RepID=UPI0028D51D5F|nr:SPOR domain-containing protein [Massilia timonae]